jgi:hypothetical protein
MIAVASAPELSVPTLPPSGREFEIYRRTAVEGRTTRDVAAEFEMSQTRVVQLRNRVLEWIGTHLPPLNRLSKAERLRVAETLECEQLQHQYDEAMEAWRKSQGVLQTTRRLGMATHDAVTVLRDTQGDPRYLRLAGTISKVIAKQGMVLMPDPGSAQVIPVHVADDPVGPAATTSEDVDGDVSDPRYDCVPGCNWDAGTIQLTPIDHHTHPEEDCSNSPSSIAAANAARTQRPAPRFVPATSSAAHEVRKSVVPAAEIDDSQTVQAVLQELDNVPHKTRKQRQRALRMRQELFGPADVKFRLP